MRKRRSAPHLRGPPGKRPFMEASHGTGRCCEARAHVTLLRRVCEPSSLSGAFSAQAQHVLEAPISWLLSFAYIAVTVTIGATPLSEAVAALYDAVANEAADAAVTNLSDAGCALPVGGAEMPSWLNHARGFVDAVIYAFLPCGIGLDTCHG